MQFTVMAFDGTDDDATGRRIAERDAHLARPGMSLPDEQILFEVTILDADERSAGSMLIVDFPSRAEFDAWLEAEPRITGRVWQDFVVERSWRRGSTRPDNPPRRRQFLVFARDGDDAQALERRMAVREAHLASTDQGIAEGRVLYTSALLSSDETMIGSVLVLDAASKDEVIEWLKTEPYVTGDVWRTVKVHACRVHPATPGRP